MPGSLSLGPPPYLLTDNGRLRKTQVPSGTGTVAVCQAQVTPVPKLPRLLPALSYLDKLVWVQFLSLATQSPSIHRCPEVLLVVFRVFVDFLEKSSFETLSLVLIYGTSVQSYPSIVWMWTTTQGNTSDHILSPGSFHVFNWSHATLIATIQL